MLDGFTAGAMLNAAMNGGVDQMADLYKSFMNSEDSGPSDEARAFYKKHAGKTCKIKYTTHEGIIHKLNESTSGFYPGSRCPIYVKITNDGDKGSVFEYDLDQIEVTG